MNRDVMLCAINDLKNIIEEIERKDTITDKEYIRLEKEINAFLVNLSAYRLRNMCLENRLLTAFQYAFNLAKHEKKLATVKCVKKGGIHFPITFPMIIPSNDVYWIDIKKIEPYKNCRNQYNSYLEKLNGKRIIDTIKELEEIL